jgi:putative MATE family efflux protein
MKDLTQDSVGRHIFQMAVPVAAGMFFQTLYFLIDLYFVARLGDAALAGVGAAGNVSFLVFALTQVLGVGTVALISHAAGRKDREDATLVFNQSLVLSAACALVTLVFGYALARIYMGALGAEPATVAAGVEYLYWFLPSLALQFALVVMGSALRGTGIVQPTMIVQVITVILNAVLAPVLIAGWLTGRPLGVAGAGLASSLAVAVGVVMLGIYFRRLEKYVGYRADYLRPQLATWGRLMRIGLPAGGEFALMFVFMAVMYLLIRRFGQDTQAGYGVGMRLMQSMFMPAMAVSLATAPIVGQNYAAGRYDRVREAFKVASIAGAVIMLALTALCQWRADWVLTGFTTDHTATAVAAQFLQISSLNFVASGFVFTCSAMFQGLGNTVPSIVSSASRIVSFMIPAVWLAAQPQFQPVHLWYASVVSMTIQAVVSLVLVRSELRRRLNVKIDAAPARA